MNQSLSLGTHYPEVPKNSRGFSNYAVPSSVNATDKGTAYLPKCWYPLETLPSVYQVIMKEYLIMHSICMAMDEYLISNQFGVREGDWWHSKLCASRAHSGWSLPNMQCRHTVRAPEEESSGRPTRLFSYQLSH